jgi:hypothetical protein
MSILQKKNSKILERRINYEIKEFETLTKSKVKLYNKPNKELIFKFDNKIFKVILSLDYPFNPPLSITLIKLNNEKINIDIPITEWSAGSKIKQYLLSELPLYSCRINPLIKDSLYRLLFKNITHSLLLDLNYNSPFCSLSFLKPVSTYPDDGLNKKSLESFIDVSKSFKKFINQFKKFHRVQLYLNPIHCMILIGISIISFPILLKLFNYEYDEALEYLTCSDFSILTLKQKLFIHMCFADLFKFQNESRFRVNVMIKNILLLMTIKYVILLNENNLIELSSSELTILERNKRNIKSKLYRKYSRQFESQEQIQFILDKELIIEEELSKEDFKIEESLYNIFKNIHELTLVFLKPNL